MLLLGSVFKKKEKKATRGDVRASFVCQLGSFLIPS
jgi:hypothetical protein